MSIARVLLRSAIDYAGQFPPAGLSLPDAARNYAGYLSSGEQWALGRFVVAATRLADLGALVRTLRAEQGGGGPPWRLTVVGTANLKAEAELIAVFNATHHGLAVVDSIEFKAGTPGHIEGFLRQVPDSLSRYVEIPLSDDPGPLLHALKAAGGFAKIRTGGVTADAFPPPDQVLRFLRAAVAARVPFKATAGLHHPVRGSHRLTYEADSARAVMYGYLNVFVAAVLLRAGADPAEAAAALEERDSKAFGIGGDRLIWRAFALDGPTILTARDTGLHSFGSCSFREPMDELADLLHAA